MKKNLVTYSEISAAGVRVFCCMGNRNCSKLPESQLAAPNANTLNAVDGGQ